MKLNIEIEMENVAFDGVGGGSEVARILRNLADNCDGMDMQDYEPEPIRDINGNRVGIAYTE